MDQRRSIRNDWLPVALCSFSLIIGIIAIAGYALGDSMTGGAFIGRPVSFLSALTIIALAVSLLVLRSSRGSARWIARRIAVGVVVFAIADLSWAALSPDLNAWQNGLSRGGVLFHPYPVTTVLTFALAVALFLLTMDFDFAVHLIGSAVLFVCMLFLVAYQLRVPSLIDPLSHVAPVLATTLALAAIATSALIAEPRGWVAPLLSRTPAGMMTRVLLPAAVIVPFVSLAIGRAIANSRSFTPEFGLTVAMATYVFFSLAIVLGAGTLLYDRELDRVRLAAIVTSSPYAIARASTIGIIETWNGGAERMFGYTAAEAIGRSASMLVPDERLAEFPAKTRRVVNGERIDRFETQRKAKDGHLLDVRISLTPLMDDDGNVVAISSITEDITEEKREHVALQKSEERLQLAQHAARIGTFDWDLESDTFVPSDEFLAIHGETRETFKGRNESLRAKVIADDVGVLQRAIENAKSTGEFLCEFREGWRDGSIHWIHSRGKVLFAESGTAARMIGVSMDITDRKNTEEALKQAQRVAHLGHWTWSAATEKSVWSDEVFRIFDLPPTAAPTTELFVSLLRSEDRPDFEAAIAEGSKTTAENGISVDLRITTPAGREIVISDQIVPDRDEAGNLAGFHGTVQDITRRVEIEQALRAREAELKEAQQIVHIGSWTLYPDNGEVRPSDELLRIFDLAPDDDVSKYLQRIHPDDRLGVEAEIAAGVRAGSFDVEFRIVLPDGSTRFAHAVARRWNVAHRVALIGTTQDVTAQKLTEESLRRHGESLERSNLELERFNRVAVGREIRMLELKRQVNQLCTELGRPEPYELPEEYVAEFK